MSMNTRSVVLVSFLAAAGLAGCSSNAESPAATLSAVAGAEQAMPAAVQAVIDKVTGLASRQAAGLDGRWGDRYAALMASGQGTAHADFPALKASLDALRIGSGAYYVYMLSDIDPSDDFFEITVDGSESPDDWLTQYAVEGQFRVAMDGTPKAALSAWNNGTDDPVWSAFAPVHDSQGRVVGILGVDYPAPEILKHPEWNRDAPEWNGQAVP